MWFFPYFFGTSGKWVGAFGVSDGREKSFGAPEAQISLQPPKFEPLPKRFFSPHNSKAPICQGHLCIYRMNQFFIEGMTELLVKPNEVKNLACEKS